MSEKPSRRPSYRDIITESQVTALHAGLTDAVVRTFYDKEGGRMFDHDLLTGEINAYLQAEEVCVAGAVASGHIDHLVEIGCGYGRYRRWALEVGIHYDGLDISPNLVANAEKIENTGGLRSSVHLASAETLEDVYASNGITGLGLRTMVLFPFNCFGNVARPQRVANALAHLRLTTLLSTYVLDDHITKMRVDYYRKCGYRDVEYERTAKGVQVRSSDGLNAYGYDLETLSSFFNPLGFQLTVASRLGTVGRAVWLMYP